MAPTVIRTNSHRLYVGSDPSASETALLMGQVRAWVRACDAEGVPDDTAMLYEFDGSGRLKLYIDIITVEAEKNLEVIDLEDAAVRVSTAAAKGKAKAAATKAT